MKKTLSDVHFTTQYASLGNPFAIPVAASPLPKPRLVDMSMSCMDCIGIDATTQSSLLMDLCAGTSLLNGMKSHATLYAGHQFGHYVPQLGDGRALLLGDHLHNGQRWQWQLKGSGETPFSRRGDGRAVLRSTIREYLVSEAMAGLGVATTRALAMVASPLPVYREEAETAAIVLRIASSFVRFGSFEVFYYREQYDSLRQLSDHIIQTHAQHHWHEANPYLSWLTEIIEQTAQLMAHWQSVGFMHGVMNTDNMSILGLTIDYGPFAFMESYNPDFICNHSDTEGRYAFSRQPEVALWNCACLAQALLPLLDKDINHAVDLAKSALDHFWPIYHQAYLQRMRGKLGLYADRPEDAQLIRHWLNALADEQVDFTIAHRELAEATECPFERPIGKAWWQAYQQRLVHETFNAEERKQKMHQVNPLYILRTWMAQAAIDKSKLGDDSLVQQLRQLLSNPFEAQAGMDIYAKKSPSWAKALSLSCSS